MMKSVETVFLNSFQETRSRQAGSLISQQTDTFLQGKK